MIPLAQALAISMPHFRPLPGARVALMEAYGRRLSGDVRARVDLPACDNSAMDGYALAFDEALSTGAELPVVGESRAGGSPPPALSPGTAMRIFTGAPLPEGADTVLIQEHCRRISGEPPRIVVQEVPKTRGQHVRARATDVRADEFLLPAGQPLGPGEISLLAAQGYSSAEVHQRPRVAILSTGDELCDIGQAGAPGKIVNTNAYALAAQVLEAGGVPWVLPPAPDDVSAIADLLHTARSADVIVTAGGASVGDYDLVGEAFARAGVTAHFSKVAMKPGKPVLFGTLHDKPVLGLPGNPVSAMVTFEVFGRPGLRRLAGSRVPHRATTLVTLAHTHRHSPGRVELARARLDHGLGAPDDPPRATLHASQGSGALRSMCNVHALVILPAEQATFAAGEQLRAIALPAGQHAAASPFEEHAE